MAESKLGWMKELDEQDMRRAFDRDVKLVYEYCSMSTLLDLLENLPSIQIFISTRSVERAQKVYIRKHFTGDNHKELAAKLSCSLAYVYQVLKDAREPDARREADLFE